MLSQVIVGIFLIAIFALLLGLRYWLVDQYSEKQLRYPIYFVKLVPDDPDRDDQNDENCWPTEVEIPLVTAMPCQELSTMSAGITIAPVQEINR